MNRQGELVYPRGSKPPKPVPFVEEGGGPFSGPVF